MDSTRNTCYVTDQEVEEKTIDNRQLTREPGHQKDEMDENGPKSLIMEIYPWISQFKKMCRSSLAQRSISSLKNLMAFFVRNARPSVTECHTKPLRAERLKDSIGETLLFFLYYYRDVGELKDRDCYLIGMSDLLALYIDMELKASKKGKEHSSKISARLSSCLHVYLEHSTEYLLETLLKVHFMNHNYQEILDPVITKVFKTVDDHPNSSIMYVRYFLAYRLWKKLNKDVAVRNEINMIALTSLGVAPTDFPPFILESVLPQVPKNQKISTKLLLLQKFEIEKSCEEFFNFCNRERGFKSADLGDDTCLASAIVSMPEENTDCRDLMKNKNNLSNVTNNVASSVDKMPINESSLVYSSNNKSTVTKSAINTSAPSLRKSKKINEIVFIDLTSDVVTEKLIRNKKTRRKLTWLENAKCRISSKIVMKKNSSTEDSSPLEETDLDMTGLKISEPTSLKIDQLEERMTEENAGNINEDSSRVTAIENAEENVCAVADSLANKSPRSLEWSQLESRNNEKNRVEVESIVEEKRGVSSVLSSPPEVSSSQVETSSLQIEPRPSDQYSRSFKLDDTAELAPSNDDNTRDIHPKVHASEQPDSKDKPLAETNVPSQTLVKPERLNSPPNEIINEPVVSSEMEVQVTAFASDVAPVSSETCSTGTKKIRETEFQDNIDGLSLLASVSQRISHLTTTPTSLNPPEVIKVKNYALLANIKVNEEPDTSQDALPFFNNLETSMADKMIDIYPESAMDKVAYQVEITSTEDTDSYPSCGQPNGLVTFPNVEETRCNPQSQAIVDSTNNLMEKDETNVILNGETVVLFQKSPNSNLYIINKAVENRDHVNDEVANLHREINDRVNDPTGFSYEIYDSLYRSQVSNYDLTQFNRELSSQESRRNKIKPEQLSEKKSCDPLELTQSGKKLDTIDDKTRIKRKLSNSNISRRRRIKQEYNDCPSNIPNHLQANYGIQDCPPKHSDQKHSIHIPVAHSTPIYTKYSSGTELYLPCHKNCTSIACALPVNPPTSLHSHSTKNTAGNPRCSCLNCTYDLMTHCTECIIPNGDTRTNSIDPHPYYMPIRAGQNSNVPECNRTSVDDTLAKIYDKQLVCNFEQKILDAKPLENVKYELKGNYRAELDNKLPLKKRFKAFMAMSFVDDDPVKLENSQSYPGTPMLSIAALEASQNRSNTPDLTRSNNNCLDINSTKLGNRDDFSNSQTREMIRRDYCKDGVLVSPPHPGSIQNSHQSSAKRKRSQNASDRKDLDTKPRISDKIKDTEMSAPSKKPTRQTRTSKRNVPKVNYIYTDADSDWNPPGANVTANSLNKRKRKRTSR